MQHFKRKKYLVLRLTKLSLTQPEPEVTTPLDASHFMSSVFIGQSEEYNSEL